MVAVASPSRTDAAFAGEFRPLSFGSADVVLLQSNDRIAIAPILDTSDVELQLVESMQIESMVLPTYPASNASCPSLWLACTRTRRSVGRCRVLRIDSVAQV